MNDQLKQAIIDGNEGVALALTQALLAGGASARQVLDEALLPGMEVVGARMREGECFIPEVLLSARVMQACLDLLRPHMAAGEEAGMGTVDSAPSRATCTTSARTSSACSSPGPGFEVVNLGTGVTSAAFVAAVKHATESTGISALLTTTLPHMAETIALLKAEGLREAVKVMVGGAPVTAAYAAETEPTATAPTPAWRWSGRRSWWDRRAAAARHRQELDHTPTRRGTPLRSRRFPTREGGDRLRPVPDASSMNINTINRACGLKLLRSPRTGSSEHHRDRPPADHLHPDLSSSDPSEVAAMTTRVKFHRPKALVGRSQ